MSRGSPHILECTRHSASIRTRKLTLPLQRPYGGITNAPGAVILKSFSLQRSPILGDCGYRSVPIFKPMTVVPAVTLHQVLDQFCVPWPFPRVRSARPPGIHVYAVASPTELISVGSSASAFEVSTRYAPLWRA